VPTRPFEVPVRVAAIRAALVAAGGFTFEEAPPLDEFRVMALHDPAYVAYLRETSDALARPARGMPNFAIPSVFPYSPGGAAGSPRGKARAGHYCFDTYTPIVAGTFAAALASASAALHGAELLAQDAERSLYVLGRPPGHHAERFRCGGYSYFNNAALAADRLAPLGRTAVLDLDVHHGNGTQHLFYDRPEVLVVSLHGDPAHLFPHFSGYAEETGTGPGLGCNLNLPLPPGTNARTYRPALETACAAIVRFRSEFLVVSLGTDAHEADPIGGFKLPQEYFREMGQAVRALALPTLIVQEGGYNLATIGACVREFLAPFQTSG
jgi:acetoin utilization deacetylase AcuC-like enzyme